MPQLFKVAWDATKLGVALRTYKQERALVQAKNNQVTVFRRKAAVKEVRRLFEEEKYGELVRLFVPDVVADKALDLKDLYWQVWDIYWIFVLLRIILVFLPSNTGYVHPDEYFQSIEVTIGDVFNLEVERTWEFNATTPLRSPTIPFLLYGLPLYTLKLLNFGLHEYFQINLLGNVIIGLVPKLVLLLLSFSVDFLVYQVCRLYKHSYNQCLSTLASSYIMLVLSTRTFSNTVELVLTSMLVYLVAHCMRRSDETVYLQELVQDKYSKAENVRDRVEIQKKRKKIPAHDFKYVVPIGILVAVGIFNRPTFMFYAFAPLFFWFQRNIANHSMFTPFQTFNFRVCLLLPVVVATSCVLVVSDSFYYGSLTPLKVWHLNFTYDDFKIAPFNFIMYNAVPGNIVSHGEHPRYTHFLVNLPMLLGPLAPIFLVTVLNWILDVLYLPWKSKPGMRTVYALTLWSSLLPVAALSVVKHQEARFLLPLLPTIVLMCAHKLRFKVFGRKPLLSTWYVFNILAALWFGFVHQAGVLPAQKFISGVKQDGVDTVNLVYAYTYMPPRYPLLQPQDLDNPGLVVFNNHTKYSVQDFGSIDIDSLNSKLIDLVTRSEYVTRKGIRRMRTYLVLPTFLLDQLRLASRKSLNFDEMFQRFPHVSVESLHLLHLDPFEEDGSVSATSILAGMVKSLPGFSLSAVNVTLGEVTTADMTGKRK